MSEYARIQEGSPGEWFYTTTTDRLGFGPFATENEAETHLVNKFPRLDGFSIHPLPGCPHDLVVPIPNKRDRDETGNTHHCHRCGGWIEVTEIYDPEIRERAQKEIG